MPASLPFLDHSGEMAERIRGFDWATTSLGAPEQWSDRLKFAVDLMLSSTFPTAIYWGPQFVLLYNDAWAPIPADRHPAALGGAGATVWADIWDVIGPEMERVLAAGAGFTSYGQFLPMERDGRPQETWWDYSFTPIRDEHGGVLGILNQGNETTRAVLSERARLAEVARLRDFFDQAPGPIALLHGPDHVFDIANPAYLELVGGRDVLGKSVAAALPEVVDQGFVALLDQVYGSGEAYRASGTQVQLHRAGAVDTRVLDFVYQPIRDSNDNTTDIFVAVTDVTERTRVEHALRDVAEELRLANEAQSFIYTLADRQRGIESPDEIMRVTTEALLPQMAVDRVGFYRVSGGETIRFGPVAYSGKLPPLPATLQVAGIGEAARTAYRRGQTLAIAETLDDPRLADSDIGTRARAAIGVPLLRGGEWVASMLVNQAEPREWTAEEVAFVEAVAEISWDAVERATGARALRDSEEKFRAIANSIDPMVWSTLANGHHDYYNDRWYEFTGVPYGSTDGDSWAGVFHPDDQERAWALWRHCLSTGEPYHIEYRLRHHSGAYRWVLGRAQPVRATDDRIVRWFGTCTDIQEIVDAREVLARSREELETAIAERTRQLMAAEEQLRQAQKMEAVGQLTGGIAHDFNNMLAVVIGALDLLDRRLAQGRTDLERYLIAARDGATRAAALTQRLLAFSRQQPLTPVAVDVNAMVEGMIELLVRTLGEGVTIETMLSAHLPPILADENQLENVILNLAVNARDAMPRGGMLTLATRRVHIEPDRSAPLEIAPGDYVEIAVADSGVGMRPEVAARAFDPFFTTKGIGKGTGLGLSQVFGVIRQSGGAVEIDSAEGKGTTVRLILPAHDGAVASVGASGQTGATPHARPGETVLVVEDEERVRLFSVEALRELGYAVIDARDGREALRMIERGQRVSLLFTDVVMPEMSGRELAERAAMLIPGLKVLLTSGYTPDVTGDDAGILHKPFDIDQLARRVRAALDS